MEDYPTSQVAFVIPVRASDGALLLGRKKYGPAKGMLTLFGGSGKVGETPLETVSRELMEESGTQPTAGDFMLMGHLRVVIESVPVTLDTFIYSCGELRDPPQESKEMTIEWTLPGALPWDEMWADNKVWFPFYLAGQQFTGEFMFRDPRTLYYWSCHPQTPRSLAAAVGVAPPDLRL